MKKLMTISITILAMALIMGVSLAIAGPPGEASGDVISSYMGDQMSFNVFGPNPADDNTCIGKGIVILTAKRDYTYVYQFKVMYANIQPETGEARFGGICTNTTKNGSDDPTNVGMWHYWYVADWGAGPAGDYLNGVWTPDQEVAEEMTCVGWTPTVLGPLTSGDITVQFFSPGLQKKY